MADEQSELKVERFDGVVEVSFVQGPILSGQDSTEDQLLSVCDDASVTLVMIDMVNVSYLHSGVLSQLVKMHTRLADRGGMLVLCRLQTQAIEVLSITRLDDHLSVAPTRASALSMLRQHGTTAG